MVQHYTKKSNTAGSFPVLASDSLYQIPASHLSNLQHDLLMSSSRFVLSAPFCLEVPFGIVVVRGKWRALKKSRVGNVWCLCCLPVYELLSWW